MRTAEEILKDSLSELNDFNINKNVVDRWEQFKREKSTKAIIKSINEARKECIEECAEKAQIKRYQPDPFLTGSTALSATQRDQINKQSILSLIKELK